MMTVMLTSTVMPTWTTAVTLLCAMVRPCCDAVLADDDSTFFVTGIVMSAVAHCTWSAVLMQAFSITVKAYRG